MDESPRPIFVENIRMRFVCLVCCVSLFLFSCSSREHSKTNLSKVNDSLSMVANEYMTKLTELEQFNGVVLLKKKDQIILSNTTPLSWNNSMG